MMNYIEKGGDDRRWSVSENEKASGKKKKELKKREKGREEERENRASEAYQGLETYRELMNCSKSLPLKRVGWIEKKPRAPL